MKDNSLAKIFGHMCKFTHKDIARIQLYTNTPEHWQLYKGAMKPKKFIGSLQSVETFVSANSNKHQFFNTCLFGKLPEGVGRGRCEHATRQVMLWADLDCKKSQDDAMHPTKMDVRDFLSFQSGLPKPSVIIDSGNGLHVYWLLTEPIDLTDDSQRADAVRVNDAIDDVFGKWYRENGWKHEKTGDLTRVLRIPGSFNVKDPKSPKRVFGINPNGESITYDLSAFPRVDTLIPVNSPKAVKVVADIESAKRECDSYEGTFNHDGSQYVLDLAGICKRWGLSSSETVIVVREHISTVPNFPVAKWSDNRIVKRYEDSKAEFGKMLQPPKVFSNSVRDHETGKIQQRVFHETMTDFKRLGMDLFKVGSTLYALQNGKLDAIENATQLFACIHLCHPHIQVQWANVGMSKPEFYEAVKAFVPVFESVELTPHWPPLPNVRYLHSVEPGPVDALETYIDLINPATEADRDLLRSAICTVSWGGEAGRRPAFTIVSSDPLNQIGSGKSTTAGLCTRPAMLGEQNAHQLRKQKDCEKLATHIVTSHGAALRSVMIDNAKAVGGEDIESMITSPVIAGHEMYKGYGAVKNFLTWFINGNGLQLSDDMSKRCIPIYIKPATYDPDWSERIRATDWKAVLAGIATTLAKPSSELSNYSRWASWESEVLSKCSIYPDSITAIIRTRQVDLSETDKFARGILAEFERRRGESERKVSGGMLPYAEYEVVSIFETIRRGENWNAATVATVIEQLPALSSRVEAMGGVYYFRSKADAILSAIERRKGEFTPYKDGLLISSQLIEEIFRQWDSSKEWNGVSIAKEVRETGLQGTKLSRPGDTSKRGWLLLSNQAGCPGPEHSEPVEPGKSPIADPERPVFE